MSDLKEQQDAPSIPAFPTRSRPGGRSRGSAAGASKLADPPSPFAPVDLPATLSGMQAHFHGGGDRKQPATSPPQQDQSQSQRSPHHSSSRSEDTAALYHLVQANGTEDDVMSQIGVQHDGSNAHTPPKTKNAALSVNDVRDAVFLEHARLAHRSKGSFDRAGNVEISNGDTVSPEHRKSRNENTIRRILRDTASKQARSASQTSLYRQPTANHSRASSASPGDAPKSARDGHHRSTQSLDLLRDIVSEYTQGRQRDSSFVSDSESDSDELNGRTVSRDSSEEAFLNARVATAPPAPDTLRQPNDAAHIRQWLQQRFKVWVAQETRDGSVSFPSGSLHVRMHNTPQHEQRQTTQGNQSLSHGPSYPLTPSHPVASPQPHASQRRPRSSIVSRRGLKSHSSKPSRFRKWRRDAAGEQGARVHATRSVSPLAAVQFITAAKRVGGGFDIGRSRPRPKPRQQPPAKVSDHPPSEDMPLQKRVWMLEGLLAESEAKLETARAQYVSLQRRSEESEGRLELLLRELKHYKERSLHTSPSRVDQMDQSIYRMLAEAARNRQQGEEDLLKLIGLCTRVIHGLDHKYRHAREANAAWRNRVARMSKVWVGIAEKWSAWQDYALRTRNASGPTATCAPGEFELSERAKLCVNLTDLACRAQTYVEHSLQTLRSEHQGWHRNQSVLLQRQRQWMRELAAARASADQFRFLFSLEREKTGMYRTRQAEVSGDLAAETQYLTTCLEARDVLIAQIRRELIALRSTVAELKGESGFSKYIGATRGSDVSKEQLLQRLRNLAVEHSALQSAVRGGVPQKMSVQRPHAQRSARRGVKQQLEQHPKEPGEKADKRSSGSKAPVALLSPPAHTAQRRAHSLDRMNMHADTIDKYGGGGGVGVYRAVSPQPGYTQPKFSSSNGTQAASSPVRTPPHPDAAHQTPQFEPQKRAQAAVASLSPRGYAEKRGSDRRAAVVSHIKQRSSTSPQRTRSLTRRRPASHKKRYRGKVTRSQKPTRSQKSIQQARAETYQWEKYCTSPHYHLNRISRSSKKLKKLRQFAHVSAKVDTSAPFVLQYDDESDADDVNNDDVGLIESKTGGTASHSSPSTVRTPEGFAVVTSPPVPNSQRIPEVELTPDVPVSAKVLETQSQLRQLHLTVSRLQRQVQSQAERQSNTQPPPQTKPQSRQRSRSRRRRFRRYGSSKKPGPSPVVRALQNHRSPEHMRAFV